MTRHIFTIFALVTAASIAAEETPIIASPPIVWSVAHPVHAANRTLLVIDTPERTALRGFFEELNPSPDSTPQAAGDPAAAPFSASHVDLTLDWLNREKPTDFQCSVDPVSGIVRSTCRLGSATITRTVLVNSDDGTVFIHLLANLPGDLSFRVSLGASGDGEPRIEDRRQLLLTSSNGISALIRVIPFESDVAPDGNSIVVLGEGDALIVLAYATGEGAAKSLAGGWKTLGNRYDPGNIPADPTRIWNEVLEQRLKSVENSP